MGILYGHITLLLGSGMGLGIGLGLGLEEVFVFDLGGGSNVQRDRPYMDV